MTHRAFRAAALTLAALSLAFVPLRASDTPGSGHQLNLIFHGVAGFVIWPDHIEVLFPEIHDHVYKAGTWGKELRLKQGTVYRLEGVHGAAAAPVLDRDRSFAFDKVERIDRGPGKVFCSFRLPLPAAMVGLRDARMVASRPTFTGTSSRGMTLKTLPLVHTLVYDIADLERLGFGSALTWRPEIGKDRTVNLHVWSERDADLGLEADHHPGHAFDTLMSLFPSLDVKLEFNLSAKPARRVPVRGMNTWEQWTLLERSKPLYPDPARATTRKGSEVSNCIALIIDNRTLRRDAPVASSTPPSSPSLPSPPSRSSAPAFAAPRGPS